MVRAAVVVGLILRELRCPWGSLPVQEVHENVSVV